MLRIDVLTIFPRLFEPFLAESLVGGAIREGQLAVAVHDLRDWTLDRHRSVDDSPYGGGPGMVMTPGPLVAAIEQLAGPKAGCGAGGAGRRARVVLLSPQGRRLDQAGLARLAGEPHLVLVCGRYEGVDQRAIDLAVDEELSLGDYVLSGGEVPAMAVIEGAVRLVPGVLGNPESLHNESFGMRGGASPGVPGRGRALEGPQYTRPPEFRGHPVPEVLRSGDHAAIEAWRARQAREFTRLRRPDLLDLEPSGDDES